MLDGGSVYSGSGEKAKIHRIKKVVVCDMREKVNEITKETVANDDLILLFGSYPFATGGYIQNQPQNNSQQQTITGWSPSLRQGAPSPRP